MESALLKRLSRKMTANPDNYMESFRQNVRTYVDDKAISLDDISEKAGISVETLKTLLYGRSMDCKLSTAVSLAKALELSIDELVGAGTLSPVICESIQITRNLPDTFVYFIRWAIRYHEKQLNMKHATAKAINVMMADCNNEGNLIMTNNFEIVDIPDISESVRYKIFMGIRIPCDNYMPVLAEGDILLLANDRNPIQNETVVVVTNGYARIVKRKETKSPNGLKQAGYYSIRNGAFLSDEASLEEVIGYVVRVHRPTDIID